MSRRRVLVVVTERSDAEGFPDALVQTAQGYIESGEAHADPHTFVVNLCRTLGYGSDGYYVSLLADARGQPVLPRLETSAGLAEPYSRFRALQEAGIPTLDAAEMAVRWRRAGIAFSEDEDANGGLGPLPLVRENGVCRPAQDDEVADIIACLGRTPDKRFHAIAGGVYRVWPAPLLRIRAVCEESQWKVAGVEPAAPDSLTPEQRRQLVEAVTGDMQALRRGSSSDERDTVRASIAVLLDPADPFCASSPETIDRLERVAAEMNVHVARIDASELRRLPEYDALFIRSLTGVTLPSFQFALRAEALDMPVVDDSQSIIRCSNKVFLEELLRREGVPLPRTRIVTQHSPWSALEELGLPFVIKSPDGSFSAGVHKIASREDFEDRARELLRHSPLLIAQEWLPTEFDWRVTVLDGKLLFAARYYMARGHWQIRTEEGGVERYGKVEAVAHGQAPDAVIDIALQAARLIGDGMYGVDLKETTRGPVVIEVNDNPNLDADYEDAADGDAIYRDIIRFFLRRIEEEAEAPRRSAAESLTRMRRQRGRTARLAPQRAAALTQSARRDAAVNERGDAGRDTATAVATAEPDEPAAELGALSIEGNGVATLSAASSATEPPRTASARGATGRSPGSGRGAASRPRAPEGSRRDYGLFEVAGLELEYPTVNEDLDVVALVEPAFRAIAGRGTSDIELDRVGFSNEIADHVFEVKTLDPVRSLRDAEEAIATGIRRFSEVLDQEWGARLLPTAMHPWFDPGDGRLWTRSGLRIYTTYAQIFDIRTHGWMNVHATHLNLPFGDERETMAMHTAAALLVPYLPSLAASSPVHDGRLQPYVDARLAWILQHQSRIPQTCGRIVPEYVDSFSAYRRDILQPMYEALDRFPNSQAVRHEFLNSRGAVLRFARRALEVRVLDTQECVKMDVAISVFARAALRDLTNDILAGRLTPPPTDVLVADFHTCVRDGSRATVRAPHLTGAAEEATDVSVALGALLGRARRAVVAEDADYLDLVEQIVAQGPLSERIRARLEPHAKSETALRRALKEVYAELADCLVRNEPWHGRGATTPRT